MPRSKAEFENQDGIVLSGLLELPDVAPRAWALFAHCFTCSKNIAAASRITRALATHGIATLRFDFTGLGNSDGDFANSNFSSMFEENERCKISRETLSEMSGDSTTPRMKRSQLGSTSSQVSWMRTRFA